ncbi:metalloprotease 1 [Colletotrichum tofieldiae]|nr:metalloprotease 1 [Colletotrichum tofieldiae]GKT74844.1 metalloprotease 1 [Colletotrichum tofieldiae]
MTTRCCLLLFESSLDRRSTAHILDIPPNQDAQAFMRTIGEKLAERDNRIRRFFRAYILLQNLTVSVATLRSTSVRDEALTEAILNPEFMNRAFCTHMFDLYDDVFGELVQHDGGIILPRHALLISKEMNPRAKRVLGGLVSFAGGLAVVVLQIAGCS